MSGLPTNRETLEELFRRNGLPMRHVDPWWAKVYRRIGLDPKPPVLFSLAEHYLWEGLAIVFITTVGYLISWWEYGTSPFVLAVFHGMAIVLPFVDWLIRRRIRARLER